MFCCSQCSAGVSVLQCWCSAAVGVLLRSMFCSGSPVLRLPYTSSKSGGPWSRVHPYGIPHEGNGFSTRGLNGGVVSCQGALSSRWAFIRGSIAWTCSGQFPAKHWVLTNVKCLCYPRQAVSGKNICLIAFSFPFLPPPPPPPLFLLLLFFVCVCGVRSCVKVLFP